jgi:hypothetical protein
MEKFSGILVYQEGHIVFARGVSGRVLFRFNSRGMTFGLFRSSRMTDDEMEFCLLMMDKYIPSLTEEDKVNCIKFMKYESDTNIFCS